MESKLYVEGRNRRIYSMTNNNKIEEAKEKNFEKHFRNQNEDFVCIDHIKESVYLDYQIKQAIELGAQWAINQYLEDLWHSSEEVPEVGRVVILENHYCQDGRIEIVSSVRSSTSTNGISPFTKRWFYIEDLFSKKGGNHA